MKLLSLSLSHVTLPSRSDNIFLIIGIRYCCIMLAQSGAGVLPESGALAGEKTRVRGERGCVLNSL